MEVVIIEDEPLAASKLEELITACVPRAKIVAKLDSVAKSVAWFEQEKHPDLIFSDIQISDGLSFEVFRKIEIQSPIIFTTAYDQYAIEAFEVNSIDYLLKPIKAKKLQQSLEKFQQIKGEFSTEAIQEKLTELMDLMKQDDTAWKSRFLVKVGQRIKAIKVEQIAYFFSQDKLTFLMTYEGRKFPIDYSLDEITNMLNPKDFFKLNRKVVAHIDAAQTIHPYFKGRLKVELEPPLEEEIIVSSGRTPLFKIWLDQ